ncbi:unnamed protein product [Caenorhabditis angaria]|uniref:DUF38 domain-containing protein n=1 Tax=Caenorhabditis angaria TaxID=860376 RepID=A0A9P1MY17_9PELO|nr:unnamed protein product [Caenorhabditis angaria]
MIFEFQKFLVFSIIFSQILGISETCGNVNSQVETTTKNTTVDDGSKKKRSISEDFQILEIIIAENSAENLKIIAQAKELFENSQIIEMKTAENVTIYRFRFENLQDCQELERKIGELKENLTEDQENDIKFNIFC